VREALDRDPDFAQLKTLLRNPRIGDNIIYRVGQNDVYFMPVYTAGAGGVVTQLGTVAAVGAAFTGEYYVGLGQNVEEAFRAYLAKLAGVSQPGIPPIIQILDRDTKINNMVKLFEDKNISVVKPTTINVPLTFQEQQVTYDTDEDFENVQKAITSLIDKWLGTDGKRVLIWEEERKVNFGAATMLDGITEVHYITVEVGQ
jgi:hypothetical protein